MTKIIRFYGGPGSGKSTMACSLHAMLKQSLLSSEYIPEIAKECAWEGRPITTHISISMSAQQLSREMLVVGKVDYLITDTCPSLGSVYTPKNHFSWNVQNEVCRAATVGIPDAQIIPIFIRRSKPYDTRGRYETLEQAVSRDADIIENLGKLYSPGVVRFVELSQASLNTIFEEITGTKYRGFKVA